jgi:hypothetical protein
MLTLARIHPVAADWERMGSRPDHVLFQTREWLDFVAATQQAEPVVAEVRSRTEVVGYFSGLIVRKCGLRILGSPFPGWTTDYMGFNLPPHTDRRDAVDALARFAFGTLGCAHVELKDRQMRPEDVVGTGFDSTRTMTYEVDLQLDDGELFARMSSACRRAIRKAEKVGVTVETADDDGFADEYYAQLQDVFAKQDLVPTYDVARVRALVRHLGPTGRLLRVRAIAPDGRPIASGIFPGFGGTAYFWGGASWRADQILRPNEPLFWFAMRYWRDRGVRTLDLGGAGDYKRKYGGREVWVPWVRRSRYPGLGQMRNLAKTAQRWQQRRVGARLPGAERVG